MTKPWKSKTNSSNILLVLITLMLVKVEWANGQEEQSSGENSVRGDDGSHRPGIQAQVYVGNHDIAEYFFRSSSTNNSLILEDVNKCLDSFQLVTCLKMLLLDRISSAMTILEQPDVTNSDLYFFKGLLVFKRKNESSDTLTFGDEWEDMSLDEEISLNVLKMFKNRKLQINLLPRVRLEIEPTAGKKDGDFVCFNYKFITETNPVEVDNNNLEEGRKKRKGGGGGGMSMMMLVPQMIMLGLMPFTLASLKAMVMNAVMINMMALNGAIFMTIRNLVFGPRPGGNVKYVNYGYSKDRQNQSPKPVLIIHSPAAFVKQPNTPKKPFQGHSGAGNHHQSNGYSSNGHQLYNNHFSGQFNGNYEDEGYILVEEDNELGSHDYGYGHRRRQAILNKKDETNLKKNNFRNSNERYNVYQSNSNFNVNNGKNQRQTFSQAGTTPWSPYGNFQADNKKKNLDGI